MNSKFFLFLILVYIILILIVSIFPQNMKSQSDEELKQHYYENIHIFTDEKTLSELEKEEKAQKYVENVNQLYIDNSTYKERVIRNFKSSAFIFAVFIILYIFSMCSLKYHL